MAYPVGVLMNVRSVFRYSPSPRYEFVESLALISILEPRVDFYHPASMRIEWRTSWLVLDSRLGVRHIFDPVLDSPRSCIDGGLTVFTSKRNMQSGVDLTAYRIAGSCSNMESSQRDSWRIYQDLTLIIAHASHCTETDPRNVEFHGRGTMWGYGESCGV